MNEKPKIYEEKVIKPKSGWVMLGVIIALYIIFIAGIAFCATGIENFENTPSGTFFGILMFIFIMLPLVSLILIKGFKLLNPNEAIVLTLFGKYYGTINQEGFYYVNPFCSVVLPNGETLGLENNLQVPPLPAKTSKMFQNFGRKKISLKAMTLVNGKQKVNDLEGNPIEIGVVVIWKVINTAKALFNVDNYIDFVSTQSDSAIRQVARCYPYDISDEGDEKSLRGSSQEISEELKKELQKRVEIAGIEIMEARISHLAYAPEIAAAMLQRQQAKAIIDARQKIVEGAVSMVEMALNKLSENNIVELDDERKAQMVSNLMVVLCGNKDAQPIVNSGSIY